jgi:hypothetical protein
MNGYRFYAHPHRYASLAVLAIVVTIFAFVIVASTIGAM